MIAFSIHCKLLPIENNLVKKKVGEVMKKNSKKILSMLVVLILIFLTACSVEEGDTSSSNTSTNSDNNEELPVLKVAVMPFLNSVPIVHMQENNIDEEFGFKIETVYFPSGGPMNEALGANLWDVGVLSAASVYSLANYDAHVLAEVAHSEGGIQTLVQPDSDILEVDNGNGIYGDKATLKGKTIAVPTGTISHLNVNKWLEEIDVNVDDVEITHMEFPQAYQAILAKKVDVVALNPPTSFEAESEGLEVTSSLTDLDIPQFDSIIASDSIYQKDKELLNKFVQAFYKANDELLEDDDKTAQILLDWYEDNGSESTIESAKQEVISRPFVSSNEARDIVVGESVNITAKFFAEQELITEDKIGIVEQNVDQEIVEKALEKLK